MPARDAVTVLRLGDVDARKIRIAAYGENGREPVYSYRGYFVIDEGEVGFFWFRGEGDAMGRAWTLAQATRLIDGEF